MIPTSEFEQIVEVLKNDPGTKVDAQILLTWYKEDRNQIPAVHYLLPIASIFKNYSNRVYTSHSLILRNLLALVICRNIVYKFQISSC